jgi:hypothetical protein
MNPRTPPSSWAEGLYRRLLRLYPGAFRQEYGAAMAQDFRDGVRDARGRGLWGLLGFWACILLDLASSVPAEWVATRRARPAEEGKMTGANLIAAEAETAGPLATRPSRGEIWAGVLPFILLGLMNIFLNWPSKGPLSAFGLQAVGGLLFLIVPSTLILGGVVIGWARCFPRWSYPYVSYAVLFSLYMTQMGMPPLPFFGRIFGARELLGSCAFIPLGIAVLVALLVTRSVRPLWELVRGAWRDPLRVSFALYGLLPFWGFVTLDEMSHSYTLPFTILFALALCGGAWGYMRSERTAPQLVSLVSGAAVFLALLVLSWILYEPIMGQRWTEPGVAVLVDLILLAIVILPGVLLGLVRRGVRALA